MGNFKNAGAKWDRQPVLVNDHDFRSDADGLAIPYGVYDTQANRGAVFVGTSHDTPAFAADAIAQWWRQEGRQRYPAARELFILADGGGSNGPRLRLWKYELYQKLCKKYGISVRVCHYPTGASKWNPVEHRVFPHITRSLKGVILRSHNYVKELIENTTTKTGLKVKAHIVNKIYKTGRKYSENFKETMRIIFDDYLGQWNYRAIPEKT